MGDTARENWRRKRGRKAKGSRFVQLFHYVLDSDAWHGLSASARAGYLEIARLYDGTNNGALCMSVRRLAERIPCSINTAAKILRDLDDAGFIRPTRLGSYDRKNRQASEFRLTCYRNDVSGELPTKEFDPRKRYVPQSQKMTTTVAKSETDPRDSGVAVSKIETVSANGRPATVSTTKTHIEMYHMRGGEAQSACRRGPNHDQ